LVRKEFDIRKDYERIKNKLYDEQKPRQFRLSLGPERNCDYHHSCREGKHHSRSGLEKQANNAHNMRNDSDDYTQIWDFSVIFHIPYILEQILYILHKKASKIKI